MKRIALCTVLALLPVPAFADDIFCELPWFARNLIFDRAGLPCRRLVQRPIDD